MRHEPSLSEQIEYAEEELQRALRLAPKLRAAGVQEADELDRQIRLQTAIVASLKRQARALEAMPADLRLAVDRIGAEVARIRATLEGDHLQMARAG